MSLSRHGAHHGRFGDGVGAVGVINGVLDQIKLPLPGILLKKQFLLAGAIDADRADPDPPEGMAAPEKAFDTGLCSFHTFVVNISVDIGVSRSEERRAGKGVLSGRYSRHAR